MTYQANSQGPRLAPFATDPPVVFTPSPRLLLMLASAIFLGGMGLGFLLASLVTPRVVEVRLNGKALAPRRGETRFIPVDVREREPSLAAVSRLRVMSIETALRSYHARHGKYPATLAQLTTDDERPTYLQAVDLTDPWGNPYLYAVEGGVPRVYTKGEAIPLPPDTRGEKGER